jgi:hypothetical protein
MNARGELCEFCACADSHYGGCESVECNCARAACRRESGRGLAELRDLADADGWNDADVIAAKRAFRLLVTMAESVDHMRQSNDLGCSSRLAIRDGVPCGDCSRCMAAQVLHHLRGA